MTNTTAVDTTTLADIGFDGLVKMHEMVWDFRKHALADIAHNVGATRIFLMVLFSEVCLTYLKEVDGDLDTAAKVFQAWATDYFKCKKNKLKEEEAEEN